MKTCPICKQQFPPTNHSQICCGPRCTYIRVKLTTNFAKSMTKEEATLYYGNLFDDPLRRLGKTKYKSLIRAIYDYCHENNRKTFVFSALPKAIQEEFSPRSLSAVAARRDTPIRMTRERVKNKNGTAEVYVWLFTMRL